MKTLIADQLRRMLFEALVIVALGMAVGLTVHRQQLLEVLTGDRVNEAVRMDRASQEEAALLPSPVSLQEVAELLDGGAVAVDAREAELFALGHLPGAVSLPLGTVEDHLPAFQEDVPYDSTLIVYCSGFGCPDSFDLGVRLMVAGYGEVLVFEGGFPAWRDAGLPVAGGQDD